MKWSAIDLLNVYNCYNCKGTWRDSKYSCKWYLTSLNMMTYMYCFTVHIFTKCLRLTLIVFLSLIVVVKENPSNFDRNKNVGKTRFLGSKQTKIKSRWKLQTRFYWVFSFMSQIVRCCDFTILCQCIRELNIMIGKYLSI